MSSPRRLAIILYLTAVAADLSGQIKLPDIIKRGTDAIQQQRRQTPGQQAPAQRGDSVTPAVNQRQCQALVQWISILQREYPGVDFMHTAMGPKFFDQVVNLYRDESFVPLYGRSFSQTTYEDRRAFFTNVLLPCSRSTGMLSAPDQSLLRDYTVFIGRPFSLRAGDLSGDSVIAALAQRQTLTAWMQQVLTGLAQVPATSQGFEELQSGLKRGQTDLEKLWPREKQSFLKAVTDRQTVLARAILDTVSVTATAEISKGFAGVNAITALYSAQDRYLQLLDSDSKAQVQKQKDQAIAAAVQAAIPAEKQKLAAMPAGLTGASAIADWERSFKAQTRGLPASPDAQALFADAEQKRKKLLTASLPEFKTVVALHPKPGRDGMDASGLMTKLFPNPADTSLPEYQQYNTLLSARLETIAKAVAAQEAAAAKKAADEEAKAYARANPPVVGTGTGLKTSCDTYAAHPDDKGRVVGVAGVADDKIVPAQAVTACLQAAQKTPKTARFQFQLGRAYWAQEKYEDALDAFLKAEALSYAPAYFYLGMAYEDGLIKGEESDLAAARDMYLLAASAGFKPAIAAYQDFEEVSEASGDADEVPDIYSELKKPELMKALVNGNPVPLAQNPTESLHYIIGIQGLLIDNNNLLEDMSPKCQALVDSSLTADLQAALQQEARKRTESLKGSGGEMFMAFLSGIGNNKINVDTEEIGEDDMFFVVGLSGGCQSPAVQKLYKNVKAALPGVTAAVAKSPAPR